MYKVRTKKDRAELRRLVAKATRLALVPSNANWKKHRKIARSLQREIDTMLVFEDYRMMADGTLRRVSR